MNNTLKLLLRRVLHVLLTPLRWSYVKRNGLPPAEQRLELPNAPFLSLVAETLAEGHTAVIWVKGYSMRPFIEYGRDRVKLAKADDYQIGDAVLAQITPGHYVLHRIIEKHGHRFVLQGDGNVQGVEHCTLQDICGMVTAYIRPNRTILATDKRLVFCIRVWRRVRPLRRGLLFLYKAGAVDTRHITT